MRVCVSQMRSTTPLFIFIHLLKSLTQVDLQEFGINDRIAIIMWDRNIIGQHHHIKNVYTKEEQMLHQVQSFKNIFNKLIEKGLPSF